MAKNLISQKTEVIMSDWQNNAVIAIHNNSNNDNPIMFEKIH